MLCVFSVLASLSQMSSNIPQHLILLVSMIRKHVHLILRFVLHIFNKYIHSVHTDKSQKYMLV